MQRRHSATYQSMFDGTTLLFGEVTPNSPDKSHRPRTNGWLVVGIDGALLRVLCTILPCRRPALSSCAVPRLVDQAANMASTSSCSMFLSAQLTHMVDGIEHLLFATCVSLLICFIISKLIVYNLNIP